MSVDPDTGFPPVFDARAQVLILGSMPGQASLNVREYYAYPQNAFWRIMQALFGIDRHAEFSARYAALRNQHIALWDTVHQCVRPGSLDSRIREDSIVVNDFAGLFAACPAIHHIFFNGAKSEQVFKRYVPAGLTSPMLKTRLPSTSPAHASLRFEQKLAQWQQVYMALNG